MTRTFKTLFVGLVFLYLYAPIAVLVVNSFNKSKYGHRWSGFSWTWYEKLLNNDTLITAFTNSLTIAVLLATAAAVIGTLMALAIYRYRFRFKQSASGALFVVMMSPDIVLAISLLVLFILLGVKLGYLSLLLAHVTFCLPFVVVTVYARLSGFNAQIIEAARDLGASEWQMLRTVLVPIIFPAVMAGWLLGFTLSLDDVVVSIFVTGPTFEVLPLRIYSMVRLGVKPEVNALATVLLMLSLLALLASQYFLARK